MHLTHWINTLHSKTTPALWILTLVFEGGGSVEKERNKPWKAWFVQCEAKGRQEIKTWFVQCEVKGRQEIKTAIYTAHNVQKGSYTSGLNRGNYTAPRNKENTLFP